MRIRHQIHGLVFIQVRCIYLVFAWLILHCHAVCHTLCEYALFSHLRLFRSISNYMSNHIDFFFAIHAVYSFGPNLGVELENPYHIFLIVFHPTFNSTTDLFYEISRLNVTVKDQWTWYYYLHVIKHTTFRSSHSHMAAQRALKNRIMTSWYVL